MPPPGTSITPPQSNKASFLQSSSNRCAAIHPMHLRTRTAPLITNPRPCRRRQSSNHRTHGSSALGSMENMALANATAMAFRDILVSRLSVSNSNSRTSCSSSGLHRCAKLSRNRDSVVRRQAAIYWSTTAFIIPVLL